MKSCSRTAPSSVPYAGNAATPASASTASSCSVESSSGLVCWASRVSNVVTIRLDLSSPSGLPCASTTAIRASPVPSRTSPSKATCPDRCSTTESGVEPLRNRRNMRGHSATPSKVSLSVQNDQIRRPSKSTSTTVSASEGTCTPASSTCVTTGGDGGPTPVTGSVPDELVGSGQVLVEVDLDDVELGDVERLDAQAVLLDAQLDAPLEVVLVVCLVEPLDQGGLVVVRDEVDPHGLAEPADDALGELLDVAVAVEGVLHLLLRHR